MTQMIALWYKNNGIYQKAQNEKAAYRMEKILKSHSFKKEIIL